MIKHYFNTETCINCKKILFLWPLFSCTIIYLHPKLDSGKQKHLNGISTKDFGNMIQLSNTENIFSSVLLPVTPLVIWLFVLVREEDSGKAAIRNRLWWSTGARVDIEKEKDDDDYRNSSRNFWLFNMNSWTTICMYPSISTSPILWITWMLIIILFLFSICIDNHMYIWPYYHLFFWKDWWS